MLNQHCDNCSSPWRCANPVRHMAETWSECTQAANFLAVLPSVELLGPHMDGEVILRQLEAAIRTAYKSEDRTGPGTCNKLLMHILDSKHESTLEHFSMGFRVITNRGVSHEIVRHRIGHSFTQESTRYVNYSKRKPQVVIPWHLGARSVEEKNFWFLSQAKSIGCYLDALRRGWQPQDARGFLSNDCKTELVWTMNIRSARHMLRLRTGKTAHPDMQVVAREILRLWADKLPVLFKDIGAEIAT